MKLRLVAISGSPRRANTEFLVGEALRAAEGAILDMGGEVGVEGVVVSLSGRKIGDCLGCMACARRGTLCVQKDDWRELAANLLDPVPHGVIVGGPVYFFGPNARLRAFMVGRTAYLLAAKGVPG